MCFVIIMKNDFAVLINDFEFTSNHRGIANIHIEQHIFLVASFFYDN